jgi:hypothetical protein
MIKSLVRNLMGITKFAPEHKWLFVKGCHDCPFSIEKECTHPDMHVFGDTDEFEQVEGSRTDCPLRTESLHIVLRPKP